MTQRRHGSDPVGARTPEQFVELLRDVRATSQLSFWEIQRRAADLGYDLEPALVVQALGRPELPDWHIVVGLLAACGIRGLEADRWMTIYQQLDEAELPNTGGETHPQPAQRHARYRGAPRKGLIAAAAAAVIVLAGLVITRWNDDPVRTAGPSSSSADQASSPADSRTSPKPGAEAATPTPTTRATTQLPTTQAVGILLSGTATLAGGQGVDLDTGQPGGSPDIVAANGTTLQGGGTGNNKRLQLMTSQPSQQTCQALKPGMLDREISGLAAGQWLCVHTSGGRWGRLNITSTGASLELTYTIWN